MNNWLSNIELFNKRQRDNLSIPIPWETSDERMARVLREQSEYMREVTEIASNALGGLENITHGINKTLVIGVKNGLLDAQQRLSPDAKELVTSAIRHAEEQA